MKAKWASWTHWEELQHPLRYIAQEIEAEGEQTDPKGQEKLQEGEQPPGEPTPNHLDSSGWVRGG